MAGIQTYGDLNPRTQLWAAETFLERAQPYLCIEKFMDSRPIPAKSSKVISLRRYNSLSKTPVALVEGVTPNPTDLTFTDYSATLVQYGAHVIISDLVQATHEDDVLGETLGILGEQGAQMMEAMRWGIMTGGSNVQYANGVAGRTSVVAKIADADVSKALRTLKRNNTGYITKALTASPNYATSPIDRAYMAIGHVDLEGDIRALTGFVPREKYTSMTPYDGEIGSWRNVRFILGSIFEPVPDAGGSPSSTISTSGAKCDIYPLMIFGKGFFSGVALKGMYAVEPAVALAKVTESDPHAQRNVVSWKALQAALITNQLWGVRLELAATA